MALTVRPLTINTAGHWCGTAGAMAHSWTSSTHAGGDVVHIEFFQEPGSSNFTLRTTAWGSTLSHGTVTGADTCELLMVGGPMTPLKITASSRVPNAPPCTALSAGWCKFPCALLSTARVLRRFALVGVPRPPPPSLTP
jgi:hypothetical protein